MSAHQSHHRRAGRQVLADGGLAFADGAVDGRNDDGIGELLARDLELGAALHQNGLAIAHLFDGVLVAAVRDGELGDGGVKLGAGDELAIPKLHHPVVAETRFLQHGRRLADQSRFARYPPGRCSRTAVVPA